MAFRGTVLIVCALAISHTKSSHDCRDHRFIPIEPDEPLSVTCTVHGAHRLSWMLESFGERKVVGSCQLSGEPACQVTGGDRYGLTRQGPNTSTLTVAPSTQLKWISVQCTGTQLENGTETELGRHPCFLVPTYPADKVKNCSLQWNSTDWTVSGFCEVDKMYIGGEMLWQHYTSAGKIMSVTTATKVVGDHKVRGEFRGYAMDAAHRSGYFDVDMLSIALEALIIDRIPVEKPGDPELDNCPSYVTEGSNLTCRCRPSSCKAGSPRPVVTWTPKQAGDNQLHLSNIQRESDLQTFTCYQYWGGWNDSDVRTVSYTVHVYYEKEGNPTVIVIVGALTGGLAVILIIVVVIIMQRRRGSEGNTAPRTVGTPMVRPADNHQVPRERSLRSQDSEGYTEVRGAEPATSADGYLQPLPRRLVSADSEGYTEVRGAAPATSADDYLELLPQSPQSAGVYQGLQMDVAGQRSLYTPLCPGNRRLP